MKLNGGAESSKKDNSCCRALLHRVYHHRLGFFYKTQMTQRKPAKNTDPKNVEGIQQGSIATARKTLCY